MEDSLGRGEFYAVRTNEHHDEFIKKNPFEPFITSYAGFDSSDPETRLPITVTEIYVVDNEGSLWNSLNPVERQVLQQSDMLTLLHSDNDTHLVTHEDGSVEFVPGEHWLLGDRFTKLWKEYFPDEVAIIDFYTGLLIANSTGGSDMVKKYLLTCAMNKVPDSRKAILAKEAHLNLLAGEINRQRREQGVADEGLTRELGSRIVEHLGESGTSAMQRWLDQFDDKPPAEPITHGGDSSQLEEIGEIDTGSQDIDPKRQQEFIQAIESLSNQLGIEITDEPMYKEDGIAYTRWHSRSSTFSVDGKSIDVSIKRLEDVATDGSVDWHAYWKVSVQEAYNPELEADSSASSTVGELDTLSDSVDLDTGIIPQFIISKNYEIAEVLGVKIPIFTEDLSKRDLEDPTQTIGLNSDDYSKLFRQMDSKDPSIRDEAIRKYGELEAARINFQKMIGEYGFTNRRFVEVMGILSMIRNF